MYFNISNEYLRCTAKHCTALKVKTKLVEFATNLNGISSLQQTKVMKFHLVDAVVSFFVCKTLSYVGAQHVRTSFCEWPVARQKKLMLCLNEETGFLRMHTNITWTNSQPHMDYLMEFILSLCYILSFSGDMSAFSQYYLRLYWSDETRSLCPHMLLRVWIWVNYVDICILVIVATTYHTGGVTFNANK